MYLIVNEVVELEVVHITNSNAVIELLTCSAVVYGELTVLAHAQCIGVDDLVHGVYLEVVILVLEIVLLSHLEALTDISLVCAVEYRGHYLPAKCLCSHTQMNFKNLTDIHT